MTNKHHLFCSDNLIHNVNIIVIIKNILVGECKTLIESKKKNAIDKFWMNNQCINHIQIVIHH